jgi:subtilisin-like proprotein convertase family protein
MASVEDRAQANWGTLADFCVSHKFHAQFRTELFNMWNHTNFASPVATTNNTSLFGANGAPISSAGVLTATTTTSRQIQFGLNLIW